MEVESVLWIMGTSFRHKGMTDVKESWLASPETEAFQEPLSTFTARRAVVYNNKNKNNVET